MIADVSLDEVLAEAKLHADGWMPLSQALMFLARRDIMLGMNITLDNVKASDIGGTEINVTFDASELMAIATVPSAAFPGYDHAIVWDNEAARFRDPSPDEGEFSDPADYGNVKQWLVAYKIEPEQPPAESREMVEVFTPAGEYVGRWPKDRLQAWHGDQ
jgi:hypothetical protein